MNLEDYFIEMNEDSIEAEEYSVSTSDPIVRENKQKAARQRYGAKNRAKNANRKRYLDQKKKLLHLDDNETSD